MLCVRPRWLAHAEKRTCSRAESWRPVGFAMEKQRADISRVHHAGFPLPAPHVLELVPL
jgi:hypothetical protein